MTATSVGARRTLRHADKWVQGIKLSFVVVVAPSNRSDFLYTFAPHRFDNLKNDRKEVVRRDDGERQKRRNECKQRVRQGRMRVSVLEIFFLMW